MKKNVTKSATKSVTKSVTEKLGWTNSNLKVFSMKMSQTVKFVRVIHPHSIASLPRQRAAGVTGLRPAIPNGRLAASLFQETCIEFRSSPRDHPPGHTARAPQKLLVTYRDPPTRSLRSLAIAQRECPAFGRPFHSDGLRHPRSKRLASIEGHTPKISLR